jgi:xeroderma pigmentosum group C-complementing protein
MDDWNLSSDEEDAFEEWTGGTLEISAAATNTTNDEDTDDEEEDQSTKQGPVTIEFFNEQNEEEEEEEEVDWEDGHKDDPNESVDRLATDQASLKPVTLDLTSQTVGRPQSKAKKRKLSYRFEHLSQDLQQFLSALQQTHLLSLTAHAIFASHHSSLPTEQNLAHSLIPMAWLSTKTSYKEVPSIQELQHFCHFFFHLIKARTNSNSRWSRTRRKPIQLPSSSSSTSSSTSTSTTSQIQYRIMEYCAHLGKRRREETGLKQDSNNIAPFNHYDKVHLLISMVRSLGWRARYVIAFEPTPKDLDVNHPLFSVTTTKNVFQLFFQTNKNKKRLKTEQTLQNQKPASTSTRNVTTTITESIQKPPPSNTTNTPNKNGPSSPILCWVEILCSSKIASQSGTTNTPTEKLHWVSVHPSFEEAHFNPTKVEQWLYAAKHSSRVSSKRIPLAYALAAEHIHQDTCCRLVDVTPRYSSSYSHTQKRRGIIRGKQTVVQESKRVDSWWSNQVLKAFNQHQKARLRQTLQAKGMSPKNAIVLEEEDNHDSNHNKIDDMEQSQLKDFAQNEPIPTSKSAFQKNPIYVIPSLLKANEVLKPDAKKKFCGIFKGELVFRRTDVEIALPAKRWLYRGAKVQRTKLKTPIKRVKKRKQAATKKFQALRSYGVGQDNDGSTSFEAHQRSVGEAPLEDGMENLYASWQTHPWSPRHVGPSDPIPVNEFNNIELELINPGLVHVQLHKIAKLAKTLGMYVISIDTDLETKSIDSLILFLSSFADHMHHACWDLKVMLATVLLQFVELSSINTIKSC